MRGRDAFVVGLVTALLCAAPAAHADVCQYPVAVAHAAHRAHLARDGAPPLAIGDSTMLFAVPYLGKAGIDANARTCRPWSEGLAVISLRKHQHRLPDYVVMALGANSPVRPIDVQRALTLLGPRRTLVLMTHRAPYGRPGSDTATIRRLARLHPRRIRLLDWVRYAQPHPNWFSVDGFHPTYFGARKFARFIAQSLAKIVTPARVSSATAPTECSRPEATAHATRHTVKGQLPPLAIGDSTMIFAVKPLAARGVDANARVCRSWDEGLRIIRRLKARHRLPSVVVMALGANSWVRPIDVKRALALIGPKRKLGLMTHRTWFGRPGPDTGTIRRMARVYRKRTILLDWVRFAAPHPSWFDNHGYNDGLHPNSLGARKFAAFIADAVVQK